MYDKAAWIRPANTYFFRIISIPGIDSFFFPPPTFFFLFFFFPSHACVGKRSNEREDRLIEPACQIISFLSLSIQRREEEGNKLFYRCSGDTLKYFLMRRCCFTCFKKVLKHDTRLSIEKFRNTYILGFRLYQQFFFVFFFFWN